MGEYRVSLKGTLIIEAINEFEARRVAAQCWAKHQCKGNSRAGDWEAWPEDFMATDVAELRIEIPAQKRESLMPPPPSRRAPEPDELW